MSVGGTGAGARGPAGELDRWLPYRRSRGPAVLSLVCFPYAGGSAAVFRGWPSELPAAVEVCAVQLPGRERRMGERPFTRMEPLIDVLTEVLAPLFAERPFAFFGHSLGAKVAFELARRLAALGGPLPEHLTVSGSRAPHQRDEEAEPLHLLPDDELAREVKELGGTPQEVLEHEELMRLLLPLLRADFELNETYVHTPGPPLPVPMTAFGGVRDEDVPPETVEGWREHTSGRFRRRMFEGGHFFLHDRPREVVAEVLRDLEGDL